MRILPPTGAPIPFSVATAPERLPDFEIHFRPLPGVPDAAVLLELLSSARTLTLDGPHGDVFVHGPTPAPLCLIAGGTGIAQCLAIIDHLARCNQTQPVRLLWSASDRAHLYARRRLAVWRREHRWFEFETVVDTPTAPSGALAVLARTGVPEEPEAIVAGGPAFVYAIADAIRAATATPPRLRADAFAYAPR